jgi:cysteine desulfuration protein SufE
MSDERPPHLHTSSLHTPYPLTSRLSEAIDLFQGTDPETRLYLLLDYGERLPALPDELAPLRDAGMGRVHECQTPVFLYPQFTGAGASRRVRIHADVPRESPTVRGLVALLVETLDEAAPEDVAAVPDDLLAQLGIAQQLGTRRQQGFAGVLRALKRAVAEGAPAG